MSRAQVVLRGGSFTGGAAALGVPGLVGVGAVVLHVDAPSNTYRLALDDGRLLNVR
jgi:hypothetical protein